MKGKWRAKRFLIGTAIASLIFQWDQGFLFAKNDSKLGSYYEYNSIDKDGNIEIIQVEDVQTEEIQKEQLQKANRFELVVQIGNSEEVIQEYSTLKQAQKAQESREKMRNVGKTKIRGIVDYSDIKYGVVNFRTKPSNINTTYTETKTNRSGYINGSSAADGAFLGYCDIEKTKIKFRQSGVEGCVSSGDVTVLDYDDAKSVNFYRVEQGNLFHYITLNIKNNTYASTINMGPAQSYMKPNTVYYSYDGHYFYPTYKKMIDDYKNDTFDNSINPNQPYYNYFQFLSHRSKTDVTAQQMDEYTVKKTQKKPESKMRRMGEYFISNQNMYGANAALMYGVAANESAYGTSRIAQEKNNLFGHNAVDIDTGNASAYFSPEAGILDHAKNYISDGYLDPKDYAGRYYGGHLGDKASGMNVKYASDPYWGEKAAAVAYALVKDASSKEFGKYQIGMVKKMTNLNIRRDATSNSPSLYMSRNISDYPVLILNQTHGQDVSGNSIWYKIQSDPTLTSNRDQTTQGTYTYDYQNYYAHASSKYVDLVKYTNHTTTIPDEKPLPPTPPTPPTPPVQPNYQLGDVNDDGRISSMDYVLIKNHILGISELSDIEKKAGDINKDGKISSMDYVLVKNHILGISSINESR